MGRRRNVPLTSWLVFNRPCLALFTPTGRMDMPTRIVVTQTSIGMAARIVLSVAPCEIVNKVAGDFTQLETLLLWMYGPLI